MTKPVRRLVLASNNAKKLEELRQLLAPLGADVVSQGELGIGEADEPHSTFLENALAKARHASAASGLPALADDSGLCVDALDGAPGVRSARFASDAGEGEGDGANNALLLRRMDGHAERQARFVCALVAVRSVHDPEPLVAMGRWELQVLLAPQGIGGFGYDPIVRPAQADHSVADCSAEEKHRHSHRGQAMRELLGQLSAQWGWR
jgi:XTP/dITP diphosphohydrolase